MKFNTISLAIFGCMILFDYFQCEAKTITTWEQYKEEFGKTYDSPEEEAIRKTNFFINLERIQKNSDMMAVNEFADFSYQELRQRNSKRKTDLSQYYSSLVQCHHIVPSSTFQESLSWETLLPPVKNQGDCGSCYAFTIAAVVEGHNYALTKRVLNLSEQELVDCTLKKNSSSLYKNHGCDGGQPYHTLEYVKQNGLFEESAYPYVSAKDVTPKECHNTKAGHTKYGITSYGCLSPKATDNELRTLLMRSPVSVSIYVDDSFDFYNGSVMNHSQFAHVNKSNPKAEGHMVTLVGWASHTDAHQNKVDYWILRNSYGPTWNAAYKGYFRVERGYNLFNLNDEVYYVN